MSALNKWMEHILPSPKVSVLVPIFNVELYLEQCLESLVNQTLKDIEIICINDGSTDSSPDIIERFAAADTRIKVINKPNSGYGASMNQGLDLAEGDFIGVVESDDYAELNMFESLYNTAIEQGVPVVRAEYFFTWDKPEPRDVKKDFNRKADCGRVLNPTIDFQVYRVPPAIWSGIYRRSFLEEYGIRFLESPGASFQDTGFFYKVFMACSEMYIINDHFLHYRQDNAASSVKATTKIYSVVDELNSAFAFLEQFPQKRETLRKVMQGISYQTFRWNIIRVADEHREELCDFMYDWFVKASEDKELERAYFSDYMFEEMEILLSDKGRYLRLINSPLNTMLAKQGRNIHFTAGSFFATFKRHITWRLGKRY